MTTLAHLQRKHENHLAAELDYGKLCKAEPRPQNQSGWGRDLKSPSESHFPSWAPPLLLLSGCLSKIQPKLWGPPVRVSTSHSVPKCWAQREKQHCSRLSAWQLLVETLPMCLQLEETKKKNGKKKKRRRRRERERKKGGVGDVATRCACRCGDKPLGGAMNPFWGFSHICRQTFQTRGTSGKIEFQLLGCFFPEVRLKVFLLKCCV